jgi:hypothetical protein
VELTGHMLSGARRKQTFSGIEGGSSMLVRLRTLQPGALVRAGSRPSRRARPHLRCAPFASPYRGIIAGAAINDNGRLGRDGNQQEVHACLRNGQCRLGKSAACFSVRALGMLQTFACILALTHAFALAGASRGARAAGASRRPRRGRAPGI